MGKKMPVLVVILWCGKKKVRRWSTLLFTLRESEQQLYVIQLNQTQEFHFHLSELKHFLCGWKNSLSPNKTFWFAFFLKQEKIRTKHKLQFYQVLLNLASALLKLFFNSSKKSTCYWNSLIWAFQQTNQPTPLIPGVLLNGSYLQLSPLKAQLLDEASKMGKGCFCCI